MQTKQRVHNRRSAHAQELSDSFARIAPSVIKQDEGFAAADADEVDAVARVLVDLAPIVLRLNRERRGEIRTELLRQFVGGSVTPQPVDVEEARQRAEILRSLFASTAWAAPAELAKITGVTVPAVLEWKKKGKIFAVDFEGKEWYPLYAISTGNRPVRELAKIIAVLNEYSDLRKAVWFDSASSFLAGARPRELLATDPAWVLAAAEDVIASEHVA